MPRTERKLAFPIILEKLHKQKLLSFLECERLYAVRAPPANPASRSGAPKRLVHQNRIEREHREHSPLAERGAAHHKWGEQAKRPMDKNPIPNPKPRS
jgi:hypothetical protein